MLLVEGNELYREVLKGHMIQWGIKEEETGDAESVIEVIDAAGTFDFGVFDISLPVMNGRSCRVIALASQCNLKCELYH